MLDEVILCSELPYRKEWRDNLLQIKYFGHSTGGVEFLTCLIKSLNPEVRLHGFFSYVSYLDSGGNIL